MSVAQQTDVPNLKASQVDEVSNVLARAFFDDPMTMYIMPDENKRRRALPWFFQKAAQVSHRYGDPFTTAGQVEGAALWLPPGNTILTLPKMIRVGMLAAPIKFGLPTFMKFLSATNQLEHLHKRDVPPDHWYLFVLGVEPERQGHGLGGKLLQPILERADRDRLPCYLETMKEINVTFYKKQGFEVVVDDQFKDGPRYWTMKRDPIG
jgi:ribosomal protein S18 acetylase RimI-like enzyme